MARASTPADDGAARRAALFAIEARLDALAPEARRHIVGHLARRYALGMVFAGDPITGEPTALLAAIPDAFSLN